MSDVNESDSKAMPENDDGFVGTRRKFIATTALIATSATLTPFAAIAQDAPALLSEKGPIALALGYRADAATVDLSKYPTKAGDAAAPQLSSNCSLYAATGEGVGKCAAIPGRLVAGAGWCSAWNLAR